MERKDDTVIFRYYWPYYALGGSVFFPVMSFLQVTGYDQIMGGIFSLAVGVVCLFSCIKKWNVPYIVLTPEEIIIRDGLFKAEPTKRIRWDAVRRFNRKRGYDIFLDMKSGVEEKVPLFCVRHTDAMALVSIIKEHLEERRGKSN